MSKYQIHEDVMEVLVHISLACNNISDVRDHWCQDEPETEQLRDIKRVVNKLISCVEVSKIKEEDLV